MASNRMLRERGIDPRIPYTVDADGFLTADAPGFEGRRVIDDKGAKGDANDAIIKALIESGNLVARGRLKHQYPHSWRSKKPLIFRNTPQWFIALDAPVPSPARGGRRNSLVAAANLPTLRGIALDEIARTRWVPEAGENRINGHDRQPAGLGRVAPASLGCADRDLCRQGLTSRSSIAAVNKRILADAFEAEGADAWYAEGARERFLGEPRASEAMARKSTTSSMSGSTPARRTRSRLKMR